MSETTRVVQRYYEPYTDITPALVKSKNGEFVLYTDYQRIVAERDAARAALAKDYPAVAAFLNKLDDDYNRTLDTLRAERDATASVLADCKRTLDAAVRERDDAEKQRKAQTNIRWEEYSKRTALEFENETLRARLAACEKIVEAANGVFNDFDESELGNEPTSVRILWNTYRAAVAAETQGEKSCE